MDKDKRIALRKRKRKANLELFLIFFSLILFVTAHLLTSLSDGEDMIWMGIQVDSLIIDVVLYSAIFIMIVLFLWSLKRNFIIRGRRK